MPKRKLILPQPEAVEVWSVKRKDRRHRVLRWRDPSGRVHEEKTSPQVTRKRDADRQAAQLAERLCKELVAERIGWESFRRRFEREKLKMLKPASRRARGTAMNHLEDICNPATLFDVDESMMSKFAAELREKLPSLNSVKSYLVEIQAVLRWGERMVKGYKAPSVDKPPTKKSKMMRGRPITEEEFDRLLKKVAKVVGKEHAESWKHLLRGLWLSGIRLKESIDLHWDSYDTLGVDNINARRPMFRVFAEQEKGGKDRLLPMTPDFVELLRKTPEDRRTGRVFRPTLSRGIIQSVSTLSHRISDIGEAARIIVDEKNGKKRHATAHDLRRGFGERWSRRVMPIVLKELMRHETIETTMKYYVGQNAKRTAEEVWSAVRANLRAKECPPKDSNLQPSD